MEPLHTYRDYKEFLKDKVAANDSTRGYKALLAEAAQCQRSFMSQVLNTHIHLTPDHAAGLAVFWKLDAFETEFFLELVNFARAATPALRDYLGSRLEILSRKMRDAVARIEHPPLEEIEHQSIYYSHWYWSALHMLVGTRGPHTERSLAERLNLPTPRVKQALELLATMNLVRKEKGAWVTTRHHLHSPGDSIYSWLHHASWRTKANESMRQKSGDPLHFTGVYSLARKDVEKIDDHITRLLATVNKVVEPSPEEDVACLCLDWFKV